LEKYYIYDSPDTTVIHILSNIDDTVCTLQHVVMMKMTTVSTVRTSLHISSLYGMNRN